MTAKPGNGVAKQKRQTQQTQQTQQKEHTKERRLGFCHTCDAPTHKEDVRAAYICKECGHFNMSAAVHEKVDGAFDKIFKRIEREPAKVRQELQELQEFRDSKKPA